MDNIKYRASTHQRSGTFDPTTNIDDFLEFVANEPYGPHLAEVHTLLKSTYKTTDDFLRRSNHQLQKFFAETAIAFQQESLEFTDGFNNDVIARVTIALDETHHTLVEDMKSETLKLTRDYHASLEKKRASLKSRLNKMDLEIKRTYENQLKGEEERLLMLFWAYKNDQVCGPFV